MSDRRTLNDDERAIGGWLLVLACYLAVWKPIALAAAAAEAVAALPVRGWPLAALLAVRIGVTAWGVGAALALFGARPIGPLLARSALVLAAATDLVVYRTAIFPNNRLPGTTPFYIAWSLLVHGAWLVYLYRSTRVRRTFE